MGFMLEKLMVMLRDSPTLNIPKSRAEGHHTACAGADAGVGAGAGAGADADADDGAGAGALGHLQLWKAGREHASSPV